MEANQRRTIDQSVMGRDFLEPKPLELITLPSTMSCHDHCYTQIVIGLKGQVEFEISGHGNRIGPGLGCIVTSGSDHAFGGLMNQSDILVLNLPCPDNDDPIMLQKLNALAHSDVYFYLDAQIQHLIQLLVHEVQVHPDDLLLSRACNDTLMALLQRHISGVQVHRRDSRLDISVIDAYIERHIGQAITVAQLAGSVFLGESQFYALFKEQTGLTPHQYVLSKRIDVAKRLMDQGGYNLGQVAEFTGFSGQSTFTHSFTRLLGISPSQYKRRQSI
jgi:AraC family transcriptional regulator